MIEKCGVRLAVSHRLCVKQPLNCRFRPEWFFVLGKRKILGLKGQNAKRVQADQGVAHDPRVGLWHPSKLVAQLWLFLHAQDAILHTNFKTTTWIFNAVDNGVK